MKKTPASPVNFSVIAPENGTEAEILIYSIIGEDWGADSAAQNTDENLALSLAELGERYDTINVRLNSPGGDVMHGLAIINAMKRCKATVVTWNDGLAASMASAIWMAGTERHMAKNALLMVHSPLTVCWGNAVDMRECADMLDTWQTGLVSQMAEASGMDAETVKAQYFDGKDHWLSFEECVTLGLCPAPEKPEETYQAANALNVKGRTIEELYALYRERPAAQKLSMMARIRSILGLQDAIEPEATDTNIQSQSQSEDFDMTTDEMKALLTQVLDEREAAKNAAPPAAAAGGDDDAPLKTVQAELAALKAANAALEAKVSALGAQPGAKPAAAEMPAAEPTSFSAEMKAFHDKIVADWNSGVPIRVEEK